jgi:hypothetical protein
MLPVADGATNNASLRFGIRWLELDTSDYVGPPWPPRSPLPSINSMGGLAAPKSSSTAPITLAACATNGWTPLTGVADRTDTGLRRGAGKDKGMKQRIALLLAGVLVGALVMTVLPVSAHHGADLRSLRRQVNVLKDKTRLMARSGVYRGFIVDAQVLSGCGNGANAVWFDSSQIEDVRALSCAGGGALSATKSIASRFKAAHR